MATTDRLTYRQAAERVGMSVRTIRRWVHEGRIPVIRLGHRTAYVQAADIDAMLTPAMHKRQSDQAAS